MAKDRGGRTDDRQTTSMVVNRELAQRLKTIADYDGVTMDAALVAYAGEIINARFREVVSALLKAANKGG